MSLKWLAAGATSVAAVAGLLVLGAWYLLLRDTAEPASVADAIAAFRAREHDGGSQASPIPPGVYVYETDGLERTDALGGATHHYPRTSTISVTGDPCGVQMRWDVLEGRSSTWTVCVGPRGWTEKRWEERHTFFGVGDETTYTCTDTPFRPEGDVVGTTFRVTCSSGTTNVRGTGRVVERVAIEVGGRPVPTVHVRTRMSLVSGARGKATFDFWLARDTGLPVRIAMASRTTNGTVIGDVHYEEDVRLALTSLTPRR